MTDIDDIKKKITEYNGVLLSTRINSNKGFRCRCSKGHRFETTKKKIQDGYFCDRCEISDEKKEKISSIIDISLLITRKVINMASTSVKDLKTL